MMTLAALATTGATPRPSGETQEEQTQRILTGINAQLNTGTLSTGSEWTAIWVGLTQDRANLVYIAASSANPANYAIVLRGTAGGSPIDTTEDMNVGTMLPFAAGGSPPSGAVGQISQGAMQAFTEIIMGTDLLAQVIGLASAYPPVPPLQPVTFYVTGHSLGGALATTVSLYLLALRVAFPTSTFAVYTFAAPTAGDQNFADWFNQQFPSAVCIWNNYDIVPYAWTSALAKIPSNFILHKFYPSDPGPTATPANDVGILISQIAKKTNGNTYVQPTQQNPLNSPMTLFLSYDGPFANYSDVQQFELQVGFQHANSTYLNLLQAQPLPSGAPVVASLSPTSGRAAGGDSVTISPPKGMPFDTTCVVDFGVVPSPSPPTLNSDGTLTVVTPPGVGIVDVRVTSNYGTSPVVPNLALPDCNDQFTFMP
jgi:hypothetical protein